MIVHFLPQEMELIIKMAKKYRRKTGDAYNPSYIMCLLKEKYELRLEDDLKEVLDIKLKEFKEGKYLDPIINETPKTV